MGNKLKDAFGQIRAEEELKERTKAFVAQKTRGYTRGRPPAPRRVWAAAVCCLAFLVMAAAGVRWLYFTPTATLSIDINPSLELEVNRFDKVIAATGRNADGQALANALSLRFLDYQEALERIAADQTVSALLAGGGVMDITVVGQDQDRCQAMLSQVEACTAGQENTYCYAARQEEVEEAHQLGLSYGKYRAYLELSALDPAVTPQQVQEMTMAEIRRRIRELSSQGEGDASGESAGTGPGQGNGQGKGQNNGQGNGQGNGAGQSQNAGNGQGAGSGKGQGAGTGQGNGQGQGAGNGRGQGAGKGQGQGNGQGKGKGR